MKKELITILMLATILMAWSTTSITMQKSGSQDVDFHWTRCDYKQIEGSFLVSIVVDREAGVCPGVIRYFPDSDSWE